MSDIYEGHIAYFSSHSAADRERLDFWVARYREVLTGTPRDFGREHATAVLTFADGLLGTTTKQTLAGMMTVAVERVDDAEATLAKTLDNWDAMSEDRAEREAERYRLAWQNARQRAADLLAALVESDEERDFLRAQLKERDDEVAQLVARLAEYTGITS